VAGLLDDPNELAPDVNAYFNAFSTVSNIGELGRGYSNAGFLGSDGEMMNQNASSQPHITRITTREPSPTGA